jgi:hydrogenase nickel incorporation protein HypA/HybF
MHELRIAKDLSVIVIDTALVNNLSKITKVNITFGELIAIIPDGFEFAFREIVRNTIADEAKLDIEILPLKMKCMNCGIDFQPLDNNFSCHSCNSDNLSITQGKELFVKSIEGV